MGGPPPPALFNYTYKRLHLPAFLPCLPAFTPAYLPLFLSSSLPLFLSSSLHLFISSCLPTFLLPSSSLFASPTNASTRPTSHPRPQQASPPTIKPPSRRSPPCSPSASGVVASPSRRESRVMVWQPFK